MIPVYIFTSDKYLWALRVTLRLYEKYWNWPVTIFGFSLPAYPLPVNSNFVSIGNFGDYPVGKWSNAAIAALKSTGDKFAIVLMEDYWLSRRVNLDAVDSLGRYIASHKDVARIDLVSDRLYADNMKDLEPWEGLDIITNDPPGQYLMSLQASIWRLQALIDILKPNETAWQSELEGTSRMVQAGWQVVGTRQMPVRYFIGVQAGQLTLSGGYQKPCPVWNRIDLQTVSEMLTTDKIL